MWQLCLATAVLGAGVEYTEREKVDPYGLTLWYRGPGFAEAKVTINGVAKETDGDTDQGGSRAWKLRPGKYTLRMQWQSPMGLVEEAVEIDLKPGQVCQIRFDTTLTPPPDRSGIQRRLAALPDYGAARAWPKVLPALQRMVENREERTDALAALARLPREGRECYETAYGETARTLLAQAQKEVDVEKLNEVVRRFLYTEAGNEAAAFLARWHLDRAQCDQAYACFRAYLEKSGLEGAPVGTLLAAAVAAYGSGLPGAVSLEALCWEELKRRGPTFRLGRDTWTVEEAQRFVRSRGK